jgi:hypothetical protein
MNTAQKRLELGMVWSELMTPNPNRRDEMRRIFLFTIAAVGVFLCPPAPTNAYAQEKATLAKIAQLAVQKGYKDIGLGEVCSRLNIAFGSCQGYQLNAKVDAAESKKFGLQLGWLSSLNVLAEQGRTTGRIIITEHDQHLGYAYLTNAEATLQAATVGLNTAGNGKNWQWKPLAITDDIGQKFSLEKAYWLSQLNDIEALPDRKD